MPFTLWNKRPISLLSPLLHYWSTALYSHLISSQKPTCLTAFSSSPQWTALIVFPKSNLQCFFATSASHFVSLISTFTSLNDVFGIYAFRHFFSHHTDISPSSVWRLNFWTQHFIYKYISSNFCFLLYDSCLQFQVNR